jgi:hypothetical protein
LKYSTGYDFSLINEPISNRELIAIGIESAGMMSNVNVSFIIVLMLIFIGGIALLLDKFVFSKKK